MKQLSEVAPKKPLPGNTLAQRKRWYKRSSLSLWLCLLIAFLVRLWVLVHAHGVVDGDEALVGIQAQHILQGERPTYFYGQPHMGSLEAYLIAQHHAYAHKPLLALRRSAGH